MGRNSTVGVARIVAASCLLFHALFLGQTFASAQSASSSVYHTGYQDERPADAEPAEAEASKDKDDKDKEDKNKDGKSKARDDLLGMDIEQLRRVSVAPALEEVVTTVARQESTVGRSPAAIYVVTSEMIRRSGARTIPEALRLVPGLEVAQRDANKWAISSRGFNRIFANKLLVQIDGRTVYTPVFAGTYWDVQDVVLEDVERIEVIRGPGATLWGANAVNGVINIITKSAKDTVGLYAQGGGGTEERGFSTVRAGGCQGDLAWRAYGKWFERDGGVDAAGPAFDDWRQKRGGFRTDYTPNCHDTITLQGDVYAGTSGTTFFDFTPEEMQVQGFNVLNRWRRVIDDDTDWSFQVYYDVNDRAETVLFQHVEVFDVDFQHRFPLGRRNNLIWGLCYRRVKDFLEPSSPPAILFFPPDATRSLYSAFIQDEVTLREDALYLTFGTKLEKNDYTGFEVQPSIRLLWLPSRRQAVWGSIARAVRTPARTDQDAQVLSSLSGEPAVFGPSPDFHSEELIAYELGYRAQPAKQFSWDISLFYNVYEDLRSRRLVGTIPGPPEIPLFTLFNDSRGDVYGVELACKYEVTPRWKLTGWYTFLQLALKTPPFPPQGVDAAAVVEGSSPQNQVFLMSSWDLGHRVEFDLMSRYVDSLPGQSVPEYISLDLRLGWRPSDELELSVVGQNLLDSKHLEFGNVDAKPVPLVEVQRGVYGYLTWRR